MKKISSSLNPEFADILEKGIQGKELSLSEGERLLESTGPELESLLKAADKLKEKEVGNTVTYVVNRNINFTNICKNSCKFCAFRKPKRDSEAYTLGKEKVRKKTEEALEKGATEICLQGGLNPSLDFEDYTGYLKTIRNVSQDIHIHAFSPAEILHMSRKSDQKIDKTVRILKKAGLDSIPGTAAEILTERVRKIICPKKISAEEWEEVIKTCHELGIKSTATLMYGHVETPREIAYHLTEIRKIQKETGGFTEFVPLAFSSQNTELGKRGLVKKLHAQDHLRIHAVARLMLSGWIKNIQTSWVKLGPELAQRTLDAGVNDFSGTLMEESITRAAGGNLRGLESGKIRELIRETGRTPRERTTTYSLL